MQKAQLPSERQKVLVGIVVSKRDIQKKAPKKYQEKIFEEFKELEEQRAKEALELVQEKRNICSQSGKAKGKEGQGEDYF